MSDCSSWGEVHHSRHGFLFIARPSKILKFSLLESSHSCAPSSLVIHQMKVACVFLLLLNDCIVEYCIVSPVHTYVSSRLCFFPIFGRLKTFRWRQNFALDDVCNALWPNLLEFVLLYLVLSDPVYKICESLYVVSFVSIIHSGISSSHVLRIVAVSLWFGISNIGMSGYGCLPFLHVILHFSILQKHIEIFWGAVLIELSVSRDEFSF